MEISLYFHFPFCLKRCPYCAFTSFVVHPLPERAYVKSLLRELDLTARKHSLQSACVRSIYFGGGTPSLFSPACLAKILSAVAQEYFLADDIEVTIEANPETLDKDKLKAYRDLGINRLNLGCQSLQEKTLKILGRIHNVRKSIEVFSLARQCGFDNVGLDIIYAVPGQKLKDLEMDLATALTLQPQHIAAYELSVEERTPLRAMIKSGKLKQLHEDKQTAMFTLCHHMLEDCGYLHYEISNFALPGFQGRHNIRYWQRKSYLGLGAGAHSFLSNLPKHAPWGLRWQNPPAWQQYTDGETLRCCHEEKLTEKQAMQETIFLGLRMKEGISIAAVKNFFNDFYDNTYAQTLRRLTTAGYVTFDGDRLRLTPRGMLLSNEIFLQFF